MTQLTSIIKDHIRHNGPMGIDHYMALCLGHPEHGYYMKKDPFGKEGDFTTAPEISQLFGDMIGLWVLDQYHKLGSPDQLHLIECGPGRGTLMSDILRIATQDPNFAKAVSVHMVEMSPTLKKAQELALSYKENINASWHNTMQDIDVKNPVIIIANEFFDALPFKQYIYIKQQWHERVIGLNKDDRLELGIEPAPYIKDVIERSNNTTPTSLDIFEHAPVREEIALHFSQLINAHKGAALMIDYGFTSPYYGDSFQALMGHEYCDILDHCGDADLTSHVNFHALQEAVKRKTPKLNLEISTQADFLENLGIHIWAKKLAMANQLEQDAIDTLMSGLKRLTANDQMGELFKVMAFKNHSCV